jgi:hypothetical protein
MKTDRQTYALEAISGDSLAVVSGGNFRGAIATLKSPPSSFKVGEAAYELQHSGKSMSKPRPWLGGISIDQRLDSLIRTFR